MTSLPLVNALLNGTAACLLLGGWWAIRHGKVAQHRACMTAAFCVSALFLASYLVYHYQHGSTPFPGSGVWKSVYLAVLVPHIILAAAMLPFILVTFRRALAGRFEQHRRIARWTLPMWLYVAATGVIVYVMLYCVPWD